MSLIGYARVSTTKVKGRKEQHVDNQVQRLKAAGCERVYQDEVTGTKASRPQWDKCLAELAAGDVLVCTKLDRIGRSLQNMVDVVTLLGKRQVGIKCLDQGDVDTTTAMGTLIFHIMAAVAQWESTITQERVAEGLAAARERYKGTLPVRGPGIKPDQIETAKMLAAGGMSASRIAEVIGVSRATLYRHVDLAGARKEARS